MPGSTRRPIALAVLVALAALVAACSSSSPSTSSNTTSTTRSTTSTTSSNTTTSTTSSNTTTSTTAASAPSGGAKTTFGSGTKLVNTDIAPGTYVANGGRLCYWERLSGTSGQLSDIIANETVTGRTIVTIAPTDKAFKSQGCGDWKPAPTSGTPKTSFADGTWAVGIDIAPGTYKASGESGCYWQRVSGFGGTTGEILANDYATGSSVVTILSSDKGFASKRCGDWSMTSAGANTTTTAPSSTPPPSGGGGAAGLAQCGTGISATPGVPCELAHNVFYEYFKKGTDTAVLSVWSPQVKQYRTATCAKGAGVVTCYISGTTVPGAQVQITQSALDAYTQGQASDYAKSHDVGPRG